MRIRKIISLLVSLVISFTFISCANVEEQQKTVQPQISQMRSICELATMKCYYHNVAKYTQKDAEGILFWKKDKHFWIEYGGVVTIGIDASLVKIEVEGDSVIITIPEAKVLDSKADATTITEDSYIVDEDSADIDAEDQTKAYREAQENMMKVASEDSALLASSQQRAQTLLEEYVRNIGNVVGKEYSIDWKYIEDDSANTAEEASDSGLLDSNDKTVD